MLFYDLPRFSVDLDFDLLDAKKKAVVLEELKIILEPMGVVREVIEKRFTLFFLLDYGRDERNLKVEISKRPTPSMFLPQNFLGQSMLIMNKPDMMACKLSALATRKKFAVRDMFDMWFFLKQHWEMNRELVVVKSDLDWKDAIRESISRVEKIESTSLLQGLGELLPEKQKMWVKEKLRTELLFLLKLQLELRK